MEYHANGRGDALRHAKLIFEGSWALLLNSNSRELVPITNRSGCK